MPKGYGEGPPQIGKQKLYFALILNWFIKQIQNNVIKYNDTNLNKEIKKNIILKSILFQLLKGKVISCHLDIWL